MPFFFRKCYETNALVAKTGTVNTENAIKGILSDKTCHQMS